MILPFVREMLADLENSAPFERVRRHLSAGSGRRTASGLTFTACALYLPYFVRAANAPCLVVVADNKAAEALHAAVLAACDLTGALNSDSVLRLPAHDVLPFENLSPHPEIQESRATTLWKIATGSARLVIAPVEAACMRLFPRNHYAALALLLRRGEEYLPDMLVEHLLSVGYTRVDVVEMPGQVTLRGGILDVYSPEMDRPVRFEFFGDEIESIRRFDPETQRSASTMDEALLLPLTEIPVTEAILTAINARLTRSGLPGAELEGGEEPAEIVTRVETVIEEAPSYRWAEATVFPGWEFFAPAVPTASHMDLTLLDLLGPSTRVFVDEPSMVKNQGERWWNKVEQRHDRSGIGSLIRPEDIYVSPWDLADRLRTFSGLAFDQLGAVDVLDTDRSALPEVDFATRPTQRFHGSIHALVEAIRTLMQQDAHVLIAAPNQGEVERLADLLQEYQLPYRLGSRTVAPGSSNIYSESSHLAGALTTPVVVRTAIANGVQVLDLRDADGRATARQFVLFGALDLADDADVQARPVARSKSKTAAFVSDFRDLAVGDYVVHIDHGIARYCGLRVIEEPAQPPLELMILEFADEAKLYVPLTRLDLIQKYRSTDTGPGPQLNRLGTQAWQKTKARVKKAMADMSGELLKLYAQRKTALGTAFSPDTNMQREFEDAFDFNETDDQTTAIADIKADMESSQPMDRLLCGDVGYGKTEVAMRAAFKAVQDGKQVAVLTPTTVLAFQHYESFKRRFASFPVNVEMISRFRSAKEQKLILERAAAGKVDILIGTHRVLSKDIKFQDLGLLIVDEEQRFGVRHKERLKQMRAAIDVLAMSATPIPRTLHMSLIGLRDMSIIETPPKDRMAIQTIVAKFDEKLIRTAIEMELERGGQTYFVHNRVETIYEIATRIRELVPQARIVIAHGQLPEAELERVMLAFMNHEYDVLVATSIIENGLDIPLANTIVVNRADRHGLSELYQLRGRVGRSNRRAYAYLLIPPETELTDIARRRLAALKEFSDLGAGFKIAALDLELRGAGNMLGGEQSGHIEAVGFEMYTSMLEEAVRKLKGEEDKPAYAGTSINLGISVRIDSSYIPEENQRLRMYKHIAGAESMAALADVRAELQDRYGNPPESVLNLLAAAELRLLCERLGIVQLDRKRTQIESSSSRHGAGPQHTMLMRHQPTKTFAEMLHIRFGAAAADTSQLEDATHPLTSVDPASMMKLVSRNARRGAQFTPQGVLRWPLTSAKSQDVLAETRTLLETLNGGSL